MIQSLHRLCLFFMLVFFSTSLYAKDGKEATKVYMTSKIADTAPTIDGHIDDPAWEQVAWSTDKFTQRSPLDGKAPSQETAFKILYDDKYLYIAARCFDKEPNLIKKEMSRRDGFPGDWIEVNIDSYHDKQTAFSFTLSVSGVKGDEAITNDGNNWDSNWDPIWWSGTNVDAEGWTGEIKIPFTQLRFADKEEHVWGLQVTRRVFRMEERSNWQYIPQNSSGWVHQFGELHGIKGIHPKKQIEIQPYILGKIETFEKEEGNPFADKGRDAGYAVGLDAKIGVTNDLTLDLTINPDFGQVEADPSQVNLSGFQVFFEERRPFFIEGRNILNFQVTGAAAGGPFNFDNLFYSRRIGRSPQHSPDLADEEYAKQPNTTSILGAAKLTGKTQKGWTIGVLETVTAEEKAHIDTLGSIEELRQETVEPLTNYFVGRLQKDIKQGTSLVGGMFTATNRSLNHPNLNFLHKAAYSGGIDFYHSWKDRWYYIEGRGIVSHVKGSTEALLGTQTAQERLFQRPDSEAMDLDSTRTSLTGHGGSFKIGKRGGKRLRFQTGISWRTPELELNDIGFLNTANEVVQFGWAQYFINESFGVFHNLRINFNEWLAWDFDGVNTFKGLDINANTQFKNYWRLRVSVGLFQSVSNTDLRGGPAVVYPGGFENNINMDTDTRKKFRFGIGQGNWWGFQNFSESHWFNLDFNYRPINSLQISLQPSIRLNNQELQYVETVKLADGNRYVMGSLDQETVSFSLRVNYSILPNLTLEYYGAPFVAVGDYTDFKLMTDTKADTYTDRFAAFSPNQISFNESEDSYEIDENGDGVMDYDFGNPNFDFTEFRSNLVMRWEYRPGSILFLVWTQNRGGDDPINNIGFSHITSDLFKTPAQNVFLVKYTYRFSL